MQWAQMSGQSALGIHGVVTVHKLASDSEAPLCACGFVLHGSYFANYILDICRV